MGFFSKKTPPSSGPYKEEALNKLYNLLFCDKPELFKQGDQPSVFPWNILLADAPDPVQLKKIAEDEELDARLRITAYNLMRKAGEKPTKKELLGVIVEVGLPGGLDVLAAYRDCSARYFNHSGSLFIWDNRSSESDSLIGDLFSASEQVVAQIGPWEEERRTAPLNGTVRLSFLVSDGLYFGEGPFDVLHKDPMGGPVIDAATTLLSWMTEQALNKKN